MPITSASEFEAVAGQAIIKVDKALYERGEVPALKEARRTLESAVARARQPEQLKAMRQVLGEATEVLQAELARDRELHDDLWDLLDFIDYRC